MTDRITQTKEEVKKKKRGRKRGKEEKSNESDDEYMKPKDNHGKLWNDWPALSPLC